MANSESNNPNLLEQAGDYNLEVVNIISYRRNDTDGTQYEMDIKNIVVGIELKEDIFSNVITGQVMVYDAQDVRTVLPITGLEKLELKFSTPGMPGVDATRENGFPFQIYKIENVKADENNPRAQLYNIFFCSSEMYYNSFNRVSQAFSGPIEYAVNDILRNKDYLNSTKYLTYEPTKTNTKLVIPNLKPMNAISFLASQAISQRYKNAGYLFYETVDGFNFRSVESLLAIGGQSPRPTKFDYKYQIQTVAQNNESKSPSLSGIKPKDVWQDLKGVIRYEFDRPVNMLKNINEGLFANKLVTHDSFYKQVSTYDFDYLSSFADYFHTESEDADRSVLKGLVPLHPYEDSNKDFGQQANAKLMVYCDNQKIHNDYEFPALKDTIQNRLSQRLQMMNINLNLEVYGYTLLHAGDVISFDLPLMRPLINEGDKQASSPLFSGRYLVMAIKHSIDVASMKHTMSLKCMKDSVKTEYAPGAIPFKPETKEFNQAFTSVYTDDINYTTENNSYEDA